MRAPAVVRCGDCGALALPWTDGHAPTCSVGVQRDRRCVVCHDRADAQTDPHTAPLCGPCRLVMTPTPEVTR